MPAKPTLVVTRRYLQAVEDRIARDFDVRRNPHDQPLTQDDLLAAAEGADALFIAPDNKLDAHFFDHLDQSVKVISTFSVGYEHIDLAAAAGHGVAIANTPGVLTDATADIALLLLLGASRRAWEAQSLLRSGAWSSTGTAHLLGWQLGGRILGIYGMGRIGQAVATRARAFGMHIHYTNRRELPPGQALGATFHQTPESLLAVSNVLSIHAPSTPETKHFLRAETIALLPPAAIVVNTARGTLVHDDDLIAALKSGRIAAAGLDVFEGEPNLNPGYLDLPNAYLLPHIGSATVETRTAMGMLALDNIDAVLAGKPAPTLLHA